MDTMPQARVVILGDYNLPSFGSSFKNLESRDGYVCVSGDSLVSFDLLNNYDDVVFISNNDCCRILYEFISFYDFVQVNSILNQNYVTLDLIFLNLSQIQVSKSNLFLSTIDEHHPPLHIDVYQNTATADSVITDDLYNFNFFKANYNALNYYFENVDWGFLISHTFCIDGMVEAFYSIMYTAIELFVPKKLNNILKFPSYFSNKTIRLIKEKNKAYSKYRKNKCIALETNYKHLRRQSKQSIEYDYNSFLNSSKLNILQNGKSCWTFLKTKRSVAGFPKVMKYNDDFSTDPKVIADMFSEFFQSVYRISDASAYCDPSILPVTDINLHAISLDNSQVFEKLVSLDIHKSAGFDRIPPVFFT